MGKEMNDLLIEQMRERFAGHEAPVPPEAWPWISQRMAAMAGGDLQGSLQDKFNGHTVEPDASAWGNISSRLKQPAAGVQVPYGWVAAGMAALGLACFLWWAADEPRKQEAGPVTQTNAPTTAVPLPAIDPATSTSASPPAGSDQSEPVPGAPAPQADHRAMKAAPLMEPVKAVTPPEITMEPVAEKRPPELERPMEQPMPVQTPVHVHAGPPDPASGDHALPEPPVETVRNKPEQPVEAGSDASGEQTEVASGESVALYIPTAFTVNADGLNDRFRIVADHYAEVDVRIATISGALVFHTNDLSRMWDGRLPDGTLATEGPYHCLVAITDLEGRMQFKREVIRLIR